MLLSKHCSWPIVFSIGLLNIVVLLAVLEIYFFFENEPQDTCYYNPCGECEKFNATTSYVFPANAFVFLMYDEKEAGMGLNYVDAMMVVADQLHSYQHTHPLHYIVLYTDNIKNEVLFFL